MGITLAKVDAESGEFPDGGKMTVYLDRVQGLEHDDVRKINFTVNGNKCVVKVHDPQEKKVYSGPMAKAGDEKQVGSPLDGLVLKIPVKVGDKVKEGDSLCIVSAMKMEVGVKSPGEYEVAEISVKKDQEVIEGALLVKLK